MKLKRSKDRKVANAISPNGKTPTIANTFGLPSGKAYACPGATTVCESICYAGNLERIYKGVKDVLLHNWALLKDASEETQTELLADMINEFRQDCLKRDAELLFRIHWDGDFFNESYTRAWATVIRDNSDIQFWAYTRSDFAVPLLINIDNLSLYYSTDMANRSQGIRLKKQYGVKLAYLANNFAEGRQDFATIQDKAAVPCPENNRKLALITDKGSACVTCGQCVFNRNDILFSASKK